MSMRSASSFRWLFLAYISLTTRASDAYFIGLCFHCLASSLFLNAERKHVRESRCCACRKVIIDLWPTASMGSSWLNYTWGRHKRSIRYRSRRSLLGILFRGCTCTLSYQTTTRVQRREPRVLDRNLDRLPASGKLIRVEHTRHWRVFQPSRI